MKHQKQVILGLLLLCIGCGLLAHTYDSQYLNDQIDVQFGPMFYPTLILVMWILLSLGMIVEGLLKSPVTSQNKLNMPMLVMFSLLAVFFIIILDYAGFLISSIFFFLLSSLIIGWRKPISLIATGILFPLITWYVFEHLMHLPLVHSVWFTGI